MYDFIESDTAAVLRVACRDADTGAALDLTGATVTLRFACNDAAATEATMTLAAPATAGVAIYQFAAGELVAGRMRVEVTVANVDGQLTSIDQAVVAVRARLA